MLRRRIQTNGMVSRRACRVQDKTAFVTSAFDHRTDMAMYPTVINIHVSQRALQEMVGQNRFGALLAIFDRTSQSAKRYSASLPKAEKAVPKLTDVAAKHTTINRRLSKP